MKNIFATASILLMCSGCALTTARIDVPYQSATVPAPVAGAGSVNIDVETIDGRTTYRDRVSSKKNGYGMEMAAIVSTNDIPTSVADAFKQEITARGFNVGSGGGSIKVEVVQFYNDFKTGIFSGDAVATVAFNVKVVSSTSSILFTKYYNGTGTVPNIQLMGPDNARSALIKAFTASVNSVVSDPDFINAVLMSGGQAGSPPKTSQPGS